MSETLYPLSAPRYWNRARLRGLGIVYCARNAFTERLYIGATRSSLARRKWQHERDWQNARGNAVLRRDAQIFGADAFRWQILEDQIPADALCAREAWWIAQSLASGERLYNRRLGKAAVPDEQTEAVA